MKSRPVQVALLAVLLAGCVQPVRIPLAGAGTQAPLAGTPSPGGQAGETLAPAAENTLPPSPTPSPTPEPAVRIEIADEWLRLGDWDQALQEYQTVLNAPDSAQHAAAARLGIGQVYFETGEFSSALDALRGVIDGAQGSLEAGLATYHLARTYSALDRHAEAADAYASYLSARPGQLDSFVQELRGDSLLAAGDPTGAISAYEAAIAAPRLNSLDRPILKIAQSLSEQGDFSGAIARLNSLYEQTGSDFTRATANLLLGQNYLALGDTESAYIRFLDSVNNFPRSYDSYSALVALVEAGVPVDEFSRGLVDYYAGQYGAAIEAFDRLIQSDANHDGAPHYYKGLALLESNQPEAALAEWDEVIQTHPSDRFWTPAWEEKSYVQWAYLGLYPESAQTLLDFVSQAPENPQAAEFLFQAARSLERSGQLAEAAQTWQRLADEYTSADNSFRALLLSGVTQVRMGNWSEAKTIFQRALVLSSDPADQAAAALWVGKAQAAENDLEAARQSWRQAAEKDPTGYYSERARDLLLEREPFSAPVTYDLAYNLSAERAEAETWLRARFNLAPEVDLGGLGDLASDPRMQRGQELWRLGEWPRARDEFESLREATSADGVAQFRLAAFFHELGLYRSAILSSRQALSLAGMDDAATLSAPVFFNHIRFGPYYRALVVQAAVNEQLDPLLLFSVIRQESMFEGFATSSANARGLMQVIPSTGESVAANIGWPPDFSPDDLYRPVVSIRIGSRYLAQQLSSFDGDFYAALAAYNGGPGNSAAWKELAPSDPDLFLETVRIQETRSYIMRIYEIYTIYRRLYERTP